jgi:hypothetical protein
MQKEKALSAGVEGLNVFAFSSPSVLPYLRGKVVYCDGHRPRWAEAQPEYAGHQHLRCSPPLRHRSQEGTRCGVAQGDTDHGVRGGRRGQGVPRQGRGSPEVDCGEAAELAGPEGNMFTKRPGLV